jgi:hypothetical protein
MKSINRQLAVATLFTCAIAGTATAVIYHPVDFSQYHNARIQQRFATWNHVPEGHIKLGGVPFFIPPGSNNEWNLGAGGNLNGVTSVLDIKVHAFGTRTVYTLINSNWGTATGGHMLIEFFGTQGGYASADLIGNRDIRDWNLFPSFTTQINGTTTTQVHTIANGLNGSPDVIDMQRFDLPVEFDSQTLDRIRITDQRQIFVHSGIVSGITVFGQSDLVLCPADFNEDYFVDDADFVLFSDQYTAWDCHADDMPNGCVADLNKDGVVDDSDFILFAGWYGVMMCPS